MWDLGDKEDLNIVESRRTGGGGICQRLPAFEKIYIKKKKIKKKIKNYGRDRWEKSYLTVMENLKWAIYVVHRMHKSS